MLGAARLPRLQRGHRSRGPRLHAQRRDERAQRARGELLRRRVHRARRRDGDRLGRLPQRGGLGRRRVDGVREHREDLLPHLPRAARDAEEAIAFVQREATTRQMQERCVDALVRKCEVLWTLLDAVQSPTAMPNGPVAAKS